MAITRSAPSSTALAIANWPTGPAPKTAMTSPPEISQNSAPDLDDFPHELVPEDVALFHRRDVAVVEMEVRAADRGGGDLHDRVAVVQDLRVRDVLDLHRVAPRPDVGAHQALTGCAGRWLVFDSSDSP